MGGVYRIQTFFGFLYFFYIYKAPKTAMQQDCGRDEKEGKATSVIPTQSVEKNPQHGGSAVTEYQDSSLLKI